MKRFVIIVGLILLAASAFVFVGPAKQSAYAESSQRVWGAWYFLARVAPNLKVPSVFTRNQDGTDSLATGQMFGGLPGFPFHFTPYYSAWTISGPNTIQSTGLVLRFDATTGVLNGIGRARTEEHIVDSDHTQGLLFLESLDCPTPLTCPDPFDPQAAWVPELDPNGLPFEAIRIRQVPAGPLQ